MYRLFRNLIIACLFLVSSPLFAQITAQAGVGFGYTIPMGDAGGTTIDFYNGTKYGFSSGVSYFAKGRVGIFGMGLVAEIGYTNFSGDGESEPGQGKVEVSQKILSVKLGPEFMISIPMSPIKPYVSPFISLNTFNGEITFNGVSKVPSGTYDVTSATRIGFGASGGVTFSLSSFLNLDFNVQYHLMNPAGKSFNLDDPTSHERLDSYISLNDDKDPLFNPTDDDHIIGDSRSINALQFNLNVMVGL